ncbi:MAG: aminotransferase class I/II-fold pyridoxal phosphate-dependent enzyme, partial [Pyrinomonadaceae bacterium]|nr:aminotransferase class I/II-fold pyridoxal phosphate-dependent enzyme [Pyrinomonadaceae bacterium]
SEVDQVFAGETPGYVYTRYGNPTIAALEEAIRTLEAGAGACAFASGMAALHAALFACDLGSGSKVLASQDIYGATTNLLYTVFGSFGIQTFTADFSNIEELRQKAREVRPRVMIAETISNPLLKVCDIEACAEVARTVEAKFIIDNTFASPYLCRPLTHGADIVVHSATKYLGGHGDAMGGLAIVRDQADKAALVSTVKLVGGVLSVWEAHEIMRGLKTLGLRMERQCSNAQHLAERLSRHPRIRRVYHPMLASSADTRGQHTSEGMPCALQACGLVSIELGENTREAVFRFMDALRLCVRSTSLGDVFTSVLHPATSSHRDITPKRRHQLGIADGLVRISVGIESITDIIADIEQALEVST